MRQTLAGGRAPSSALVRREEGKGREEENSNSLVVFLFFFFCGSWAGIEWALRGWVFQIWVRF